MTDLAIREAIAHADVTAETVLIEAFRHHESLGWFMQYWCEPHPAWVAEQILRAVDA